MVRLTLSCLFFFFNDTATTEIYTLSLHDALPILKGDRRVGLRIQIDEQRTLPTIRNRRSEEHTSELQSHLNLVCRLLLEKKTNSIFYPDVMISSRVSRRQQYTIP